MNQTAALLDAAGGVAAVASHFDISVQAIYKWIGADMIPVERVRELVTLAGGVWTPQRIRPDIFGEPPAANGDAEQRKAA